MNANDQMVLLMMMMMMMMMMGEVGSGIRMMRMRRVMCCLQMVLQERSIIKNQN